MKCPIRFYSIFRSYIKMIADSAIASYFWHNFNGSFQWLVRSFVLKLLEDLIIRINGLLSTYMYSGTPLNGHPSTADTHDIMDSSESPNYPSIHFNT